MTEDVKKKVIIILSVSLVLIILSIILNRILDNKTNNPKLELLTDENRYFTIQRTINDYLSSQDSFDAPSFTAKKIYYKEKDGYNYYFINGYTIVYDSTNGYNSSVNYLLITNYNKYELKEISTTYIEDYAEKYNDYNVLIGDNKLPVIDYSEQIKLEAYLSHFVNMINYDNRECYNMLTDHSKNKYNSYASFKNNISDFNNISTKITSYTKDNNTYTITYSNNNTIKIVEESLMNFKIEK